MTIPVQILGDRAAKAQSSTCANVVQMTRNVPVKINEKQLTFPDYQPSVSYSIHADIWECAFSLISANANLNILLGDANSLVVYPVLRIRINTICLSDFFLKSRQKNTANYSSCIRFTLLDTTTFVYFEGPYRSLSWQCLLCTSYRRFSTQMYVLGSLCICSEDGPLGWLLKSIPTLNSSLKICGLEPSHACVKQCKGAESTCSISARKVLFFGMR